MSASTRLNMPDRGYRTVKAVALFAVSSLLGLACCISTASAGELDGDWARSDGKAKVRIAPCGGDICATNTWIRPGTASEKVGDRLVMTIDQDSSGEWVGSAFDPQRNRTYKLTVTVTSDRMVTKGCIVAGLLCRGISWSRIE